MALSDTGYERITHPIDLVEQLAASHDWATERTGEDELTLIVGGNWTDYHLSLNWRDDLEALHLACAFDFRVPEQRLNEMYRLWPRSTSSSGSAISIFGHKRGWSCSATP